MTPIRKAVERNNYLTLAFYILSFFLSVFLLGKFFDIGSSFALKIVLFYVVVFFLISSMLNWLFYFFVGREELARYLGNIIQQFYESIQGKYKKNIGGSIGNMLETSLDDQGLSPEFRRVLTAIWTKMENSTTQQRLMNEISWRRALRRYAKSHPERFSTDLEKDGEFTLITCDPGEEGGVPREHRPGGGDDAQIDGARE